MPESAINHELINSITSAKRYNTLQLMELMQVLQHRSYMAINAESEEYISDYITRCNDQIKAILGL